MYVRKSLPGYISYGWTRVANDSLKMLPCDTTVVIDFTSNGLWSFGWARWRLVKFKLLVRRADSIKAGERHLRRQS